MTREGVIAVEAQKPKALELINEIMASALVEGIPTRAVRELEITQIDMNDLLWPEFSYLPGIPRRGGLISNRLRSSKEISYRFVISEQGMRHIITGVEEKVRDELSRTALCFFLEAYTHLQYAEYSQCFLMAWFLVEKVITSLWEEFLTERTVATDKKHKLLRGPHWSVYNISKVLYLSGKLSPDLYKEFQRINQARNDIVHNADQAQKEQAVKVIELARTLANMKGLQVKLPAFNTDYQKRVANE